MKANSKNLELIITIVISTFSSVILVWILQGYQKNIAIVILLLVPMLIVLLGVRKFFIFWLIYHFLLIGPFVIVFNFLGREFKWLSDYFIVIMFLVVLGQQAINRKRFIIPRTFFIYFSFLAWGLVTAKINGINAITSALNLKDYIRFPLLGLTLINMEFNREFIVRILKMLLVIAFIQLPVSIFQFFIYGMGDRTCGTFGLYGTGEILFYLAFCIGLLFILYSRSKKIIFLLLVPLLILPIILGSANLGMFLVPFVVLYVGIFHLKKFKEIFRIIAVLFIFLWGIYNINSTFQRVLNRFLINTFRGIKVIHNYKIKGNIPGRLASIEIAHQWVAQKYMGFIFGYGFGVTKQSYFEGLSGTLLGVYAPRTNQISITLLETGYIGLCLLLLFLIALYIQTIKDKINDIKSIRNILKVSSEISILIYFVGLFYNPVATLYYFGALFWIIIGLFSRIKELNTV